MIAIVIVFLYVILLEFTGAYYRYFSNKPLLKPEGELPAVTILVPFRNEKGKLAGLMKMLLRQRYPGPAPVILFIDDGSTDDYQTTELPTAIRIIKNSSERAGKKGALTTGIETADTHWIVCTDADAELPENWLAALMQQADDASPVMICGRVDVQSEGSFLHDFQCMETRILQSAGAAAIEAGFPFLNTGASLAFRKDAWLAVNGYAGHIHVPSGDDVFLLFDLASKFPGRILFASHPSAIAGTSAENDFRAFISQRIRWASKMKYYRSLPSILTGLLVLAAAIATVVTLVTGKFLMFFALLLSRGIAEFRLLGLASKGLAPVSILNRLKMVLVYPFYILILTTGILVYKPRWKGR